MAEQLITNALKDVVQEIRVQSLTKHVRTFLGEGTAKFINWLQDMDQLSASCDSERMCVLASLTLGGSAGTFVVRELKQNPRMSWQDLRTKMKDRYSDLTDPFVAQEKCRRLQQKRGESVQNFAERIRVTAAEAYNNIESRDVQRSLVEIFQKGVVEDRLARSVIRKKFESLEEAVSFAKEEQGAERTFEMYRHHQTPDEPMDVDVVREEGKETREMDKIQENIQKLSKQLDRVSRQINPRAQIQPPPRRSQTVPPHYPPRYPPPMPPPRPCPPPSQRQNVAAPRTGMMPAARQTLPTPAPTAARYQWTHDGRPICAACGRIGHVHRNCRVGRQLN